MNFAKLYCLFCLSLYYSSSLILFNLFSCSCSCVNSTIPIYFLVVGIWMSCLAIHVWTLVLCCADDWMYFKCYADLTLLTFLVSMCTYLLFSTVKFGATGTVGENVCFFLFNYSSNYLWSLWKSGTSLIFLFYKDYLELVCPYSPSLCNELFSVASSYPCMTSGKCFHSRINLSLFYCKIFFFLNSFWLLMFCSIFVSTICQGMLFGVNLYVSFGSVFTLYLTVNRLVFVLRYW